MHIESILTVNNFFWLLSCIGSPCNRSRLLYQQKVDTLPFTVLGSLYPLKCIVQYQCHRLDFVDTSLEHCSQHPRGTLRGVLRRDILDQTEHHLGEQRMQVMTEVRIMNQRGIQLRYARELIRREVTSHMVDKVCN